MWRHKTDEALFAHQRRLLESDKAVPVDLLAEMDDRGLIPLQADSEDDE